MDTTTPTEHADPIVYHKDTITTPIILQDDLPLDGSTTTTMSFENGINPSYAMMDSNPPSVLTDTLSSFSSNHSSSSFLGGSNNNSTNLSTFSSTTSSASRRNSMQFTKPVEVRETLDASLTENADGFRQLKQYILKGEIGKGAFGKVHFAVDENTGVGYAIKEFSKSKLRKKDKANLFKLGPRGRGRGRRGPEAPSPITSESSPLDLIRGEIAILKKLHHNNIVKLYEVLDVSSDDSMYMVFEWCEKGVLMPVSLTEKYENVFSDEECRDVFQQIVLGIEYLHEHDIIHRDIKPDNLLRSGEGIVKIVDFGVSEMFDKKGDDMTKKSAGSPAFMAPELCRHDHGEVSGRATDVWSMGVTLYCLRYGRLPYVSESILEMQRVIRENELVVPEEGQDPRFVALIKRLLEKDPSKRITIEQLRSDPWLTNDGEAAMISKEENTANAVTEVTEEDLRGAIQRINSLVTVFKAIARFKRGIKSPTSRSALTSPASEAGPASAASESEKMQDADEGITSIAQVLVPTETTSEEVHGAETVKETLAGSLDNVTLDEAAPLKPEVDIVTATENQEQETFPAADATESAASIPTTSETVQTKKEDLTEIPAPVEKAQEQETEPQGYQVCDMESGMCYWVPAKKIKTTPPPAAAADAAPASEPVEKETANVSEVMDTPAIEVAGNESEITTETASELREALATTVPRPSSPGLDQAHAAHGEGDSGSNSPARSLNPGPRLVGKLSRDRLAMFEKST